jgi:hypothetical protein
VISYQSSSLFNQADVSFFTEIFKKQWTFATPIFARTNWRRLWTEN